MLHGFLVYQQNAWNYNYLKNSEQANESCKMDDRLATYTS